MPDITLPRTFSAAAVANADHVAENIDSPNTTPDSLDVINGFLDRDNTDHASWEPSARQIQRGSLIEPARTGATRVMTFPLDAFSEDDGSAVGVHMVPGCSATRWYRRAGSLLIVDFGVFLLNQDTERSSLAYFFKQAPSDTKLTHISGVWAQVPAFIGSNRQEGWWWSGRWITTSTEAGLWHFAVGVKRIVSSTTGEDMPLSAGWRYMNPVLIG